MIKFEFFSLPIPLLILSHSHHSHVFHIFSKLSFIFYLLFFTWLTATALVTISLNCLFSELPADIKLLHKENSLLFCFCQTFSSPVSLFEICIENKSLSEFEPQFLTSEPVFHSTEPIIQMMMGGGVAVTFFKRPELENMMPLWQFTQRGQQQCRMLTRSKCKSTPQPHIQGLRSHQPPPKKIHH